jgi:uncharacterized damage-inducible protein DinB
MMGESPLMGHAHALRVLETNFRHDLDGMSHCCQAVGAALTWLCAMSLCRWAINNSTLPLCPAICNANSSRPRLGAELDNLTRGGPPCGFSLRYPGPTMRHTLLLMLLTAGTLAAQPEGLWQGYDGEWSHVSRQLVALAEATPAEKFTWRPAPGVRSVSEVYMHIAIANFWLLNVTGPKMPEGVKADTEKTVTDKAEVIGWLKRSLDAVKAAHAPLTSADLQRKVKVMNRDATVDGMYLRIIVHANEHMGQLIAYARMSGVVPPWSKQE